MKNLDSDSARTKGDGEEAEETLVCKTVQGAEDGDTCTIVAQQFNLSTQQFLEINPNINCDHIFIGQWLCVDASI